MNREQRGLSKMHCLYDFHTFSVQSYGGISRYFTEIIKHLIPKDDLKISVFMGLHVNEYGLESHSKDFYKFWGLKRSRLPKTDRIFESINKLGFKYFCKNLKTDLFHETGYLNPEYKGKRIITIHDMTHEVIPRFFKFNETEKKMKACHAADAIICISENTKLDLIKIFKIKEKKIHVIYAAGSLPLLKLNGHHNPFKFDYFLYVGSREKYKNFFVVLKAFELGKFKNQNLHLVCYGGSTPSLVDLKFIIDHELTNHVHFLEGDDIYLSKVYQHAIALLYSSFYEGFGIPPLEAMSQGCPVISSNTSSIPEVVGDAGIMFNPHDHQELISHMNSIVKEPSLRMSLKIQGIERSKQFSWDKCANETFKLYQEQCR